MSGTKEVHRPLLDIRDLAVHYRGTGGVVAAVRGVNVAVGAGETVALVGGSGSGKTTTAHAVVGLRLLVDRGYEIPVFELTSINAVSTEVAGIEFGADSRLQQLNAAWVAAPLSGSVGPPARPAAAHRPMRTCRRAPPGAPAGLDARGGPTIRRLFGEQLRPVQADPVRPVGPAGHLPGRVHGGGQRAAATGGGTGGPARVVDRRAQDRQVRAQPPVGGPPDDVVVPVRSADGA
ncbi:ATP-binding cassette domain-containing protein [Saccharopolyspora sp. NPDC000359]|uniref:ATP-binding cassette domain-containing protein n=1 Tax=Saccharopolyspora sp. NPDC000359 TaxID=3154251 RepID=UPI00332D94BB